MLSPADACRYKVGSGILADESPSRIRRPTGATHHPNCEESVARMNIAPHPERPRHYGGAR